MGIRTVLSAMLLLLFATGTFAHGEKVHVMGTITSVTATSISVKRADGTTVEVKLLKNTMYILRAQNTNQPAKVTDLAIGDTRRHSRHPRRRYV